jgi:DNA-binding transcriptional LysR family regulator
VNVRYDLVSLQVLVAVADEANLTRAAQRQHLAVSAVSKRVAELEALAGAPLLVRHARGVSFTAAGQSMLHYARQMLLLVDRMEAELGEYAGGVKGRVRLHAATSALVQFLPSALGSFIERHPGIRLQIEERVGAAIVAAVSDGSADLGILGDHTPHPGLTAVPYRKDRLALGVPASHPLAGKTSVRFADMLEWDIVGPHADSSLWTLMTQAAATAGKPLVPRVQVSSFDCICSLVAAGLGLALLPKRVLVPHVATGGLRIVDVDEPWADRQLIILVRHLDAMPVTTRVLVDHLCREEGGR